MTAPERSQLLISAAVIVFKYLLVGGIAIYCLHSCNQQVRIQIEVVDQPQTKEGK